MKLLIYLDKYDASIKRTVVTLKYNNTEVGCKFTLGAPVGGYILTEINSWIVIRMDKNMNILYLEFMFVLG
jgi:hypothetical protein